MSIIKNKKVRKNYGWVIVFTGMVAMALVYGTIINSIGLFVIPLADSFGYSSAAISGILSFNSVGIIIGANIVAFMVNKYGPKRCMLCSALILAIITIVFSRCNQLLFFYFCAIIMGMSVSGTTLIPISTLINNWFEAGKRNIAISISYMGSGIGGLVLNPFLNFLIQRYGWTFAFMTIGILIIVIYIPIIGLLTVSSPNEIDALKIGQNEFSIKKTLNGWSFQDAVKSKYFILLGMVLATTSGTSMALVFYIASYYIKIGFSPDESAMIVGICVGSIAVGKLIIGLVCDKCSPIIASYLGMGSLAVVFLLLTIVDYYNIILVFIICLYGLGVGSATVLPPSLINYFFGEKDFTRIMGLLIMITGIGSTLGPLMMGIIIDMTSSYKMSFIIFVMIIGVAILLISVAYVQYKKIKQKDEIFT